MIYKYILLPFLLTFVLNTTVFSYNNDTWVTMGSDVLAHQEHFFNLSIPVNNLTKHQGQKVQAFNTKPEKLNNISQIMHQDFFRCGGYIIHDSKKEAYEALTAVKNKIWQKAYVPQRILKLTKQDSVIPMISTMEEIRITETIIKMSSFHNRYHTSSYGTDSQNWVLNKWKSITNSRNDISVKEFTHSKTPQHSIIATVLGSKFPNEIIVLGGHGDTITDSIWLSKKKARGPGADDNASGIAVLTEVLQIMVDNNYKPERTIQFISYAAEEVGLIGSNSIAKDYKAKNKTVTGVLQLDMTNFNGSDVDILLINDYTNDRLNTFISKLIDEYIHVPWGYTSCGYACSDHASWSNQGYAAVYPFEAKFKDYNKKIHSKNDTFEVSNNHSYHAVKFAKLALAFALEIDK